MTERLRTLVIAAGVAAVLGAGTGIQTASAHNDWGLPLVGGLVGGYALSSFAHQRESRPREAAVAQPVYVAPPAPTVVTAPAPPVSSAASVEHQLNVLDELAAKGYITQSEYQARRQALLDQL